MMSTAVHRRDESRGGSGGTSPWRALRIAAIVLAVVAVVAFIVVRFTPLFVVRDYEVTGNENVTQEQVLDAAGVPAGRILAQVDVAEAAGNVEQLSWVRDAQVSRGWPSTLRIDVAEQQAVAYVDETDGTHLINPEGVAFIVAQPPAAAVEITGDARTDEAARRNAVAIAASISEEARTQVDEIEARDEFNFAVLLDDERTVVWGASEDNHDKSLALETVLGLEGSQFDISNPQQVAVR